MSEFTITLGRTGHVVKRKRGDLDVSPSDPIKSKSVSVKYRLGPCVGENPSSSGSKRLRGNDSRKIVKKDAIKDARLGHKDLRLKLLQKRSSGPCKSHNDGADGKKRSDVQHDVSAPPKPSPRSCVNSNMPTVDPTLGRNGHAMQFSARDRGRDSYYRDSPRNYYSSLTPGGLRVRSPERALRSPRNFSPPVPQAEFRGVSSIRPSAMSAPQHVLRNGVHDPHNPRPLQPPPMISPSAVVCRPVAPLPPPNGMYQRSLYWGEASVSVPFLLHSLGLEKYVIQFQAEEIDMSVLKQMSEKDLKDMQIPMGPRKKIMQAVMVISKRPPAPQQPQSQPPPPPPPGPPPPMLPPRPL